MATILIVEDDRVQRELLTAILEPTYQIAEATDATEAIIQARSTRPNLILLDLNLKGYHDGLKVCHALRKEPDPTLAQVPVVVVSGFMDEEDIAAALAAGADSYLSKPWNRSALLALVDRLLAGKKE
ncbi:MAG: response regulator [Anaerolineales bacterium]|nr:response regulator [Anaerolineales bacterium]